MSKNGGNIFPESIIFAFIFSPKHNKKFDNQTFKIQVKTSY